LDYGSEGARNDRVPLRVAIDAVGVRTGGGATLLNSLVEQLSAVEPDWQIDLYLLPRKARQFDNPRGLRNVRVQIAAWGDSGLSRLYWIYRGLPQKLRQTAADAVIAFANIGGPFGSPPQIVYCQQMLPFVELASSAWTDRVRMAVLRRCIVRGAEASAWIVVQTESMRKALRVQLTDRADRRVVVVPPGIYDTNPDESVDAEFAGLLQRAGRPRLIYVSSLGQHKNHATLLAALEWIRKDFPKCSLWLTMDRAEAEREFGRSLVREHESRGRFVFLGYRSQNEVRYALRAADLSVFPSLVESFGLPLVEAISEGCPVAAADRGYAREVLGNAGVFFDPLDPRSIAAAVSGLLASQEQLLKMRSAGRCRASQFDARTSALGMARLVRAAVGS